MQDRVTDRLHGVTLEAPSTGTALGEAIDRAEVRPSRKALIGYWVCTLFVAIPALAAGTMDVLHLQPLFVLLLHLGYPAYFATILGVWKVLGAIVLLAPRYPLIKEWAYAGMVIDYTSAVLSHSAWGDGVGAIAARHSRSLRLPRPGTCAHALAAWRRICRMASVALVSEDDWTRKPHV
jgi:uncharacterized membrane protein YphA (DoxX/SURF4 family)